MSRLPRRPPAYPSQPVGVQPLGYYRNVPGQRIPHGAPMALQFVCGLLALNASVFLATILLFGLRNSAEALLAIALGLLILSIWLRCHLGWKAFIPGALTGLLLAPVAFFFACAARINF